jgi:hypothetical protein
LSASAKGASLDLACQPQDTREERTVLAQAPSGARRAQEHVLEVASKKGARRFVDKPPHDEDGMSGLHWRYCGYDAHAKAHLIEKQDEGSYSGEILLEETGKILPAGHTVLFSKNQKEFLAIEQEDGMDGELWAVYDTAGKTKWKGYAGTTAPGDGGQMIISTFDRPQWNRRGELTARFVCAASKVSGTVTLAPSSPGPWIWRGHAKCTK